MSGSPDYRLACPFCGSQEREPCRDAQGDFVNYTHGVRITEVAQLDPVNLLRRIEAIEARLGASSQPVEGQEKKR